MPKKKLSVKGHAQKQFLQPCSTAQLYSQIVLCLYTDRRLRQKPPTKLLLANQFIVCKGRMVGVVALLTN